MNSRSPKRRGVGALLLAVAGAAALASSCRKEAPPAPPPPPPAAPAEPEPSPEARKWTWLAPARTGRASIRQTSTGEGHCRVEAQGAADAWSVEACLGDAMALHFASDDGLRLLVLDPLPDRREPWQSPTVVRLFERGVLVRETNLGAYVPEPSKLVKFNANVAWLQGTSGVPGTAPRFADDGTVTATVVTGLPLTLGFDGAGIPPPVTTAVAAPKATAAEIDQACDGMLEWTDGAGTHYTDSLANVPAAARKHVKCTSGGEVTVVAPVRYQGTRRPSVDSASEGPRPKAAAPAPKAGIVFCKYVYMQKPKPRPNITVVGPGRRMEDSYCTSGPLADAQRRCDAEAKRQHEDVAPCWCSDDATYIGSRCD